MEQTVTLKFTRESYQDLQVLAKNLNVSVEKVIAQSLALLKVAQGRKIILKTERETVEIHNFRNLPTQAKLEPR